ATRELPMCSFTSSRLKLTHKFHKRCRQSLSRACNSPRKPNQLRDTRWMREQVRRQLEYLRLLPFDVEQDLCWRREKFARCVTNYSKRKHRNGLGSNRPCNELRLHVHGRRSRCKRKLVSLLGVIE